MNQIAIACSWLDNLDNRYTDDDRPRLRPAVQAWMEDLAMEIKSSIKHLEVKLGPQIIVDVEMFLPNDGIDREPAGFLKAILDAVEMATGLDTSNFVPFLRSSQTVGAGPLPETDTGFMVRIYSAFFGPALVGTITHQESGATMIVLDKHLSPDWSGARVTIKLGVMRNE